MTYFDAGDPDSRLQYIDCPENPLHISGLEWFYTARQTVSAVSGILKVVDTEQATRVDLTTVCESNYCAALAGALRPGQVLGQRRDGLIEFHLRNVNRLRESTVLKRSRE